MSFWSLRGIRVLVTGGIHGINSLVIKELEALDAEVLIVDVEPTTDDRIIYADLTNDIDRNRIVRQIHDRWGALDILVNNPASASARPWAQWLKHEAEKDDIEWSVSQSGISRLANDLFDLLQKGNQAQVVNVTSEGGWFDPGTQTIMLMGYDGILDFTHNLASKWGPQNIRVNAITPMYFHAPTKKQEAMLAYPGRPEKHLERTFMQQIAAAVVFLATNRSTALTGRCLALDGWIYGLSI